MVSYYLEIKKILVFNYFLFKGNNNVNVMNI